MKAAAIRADRLSDGGRLLSQCVVFTLQKKGVAVKCGSGSRQGGAIFFTKRKWRDHQGPLISSGIELSSSTSSFFSEDSNDSLSGCYRRSDKEMDHNIHRGRSLARLSCRSSTGNASTSRGRNNEYSQSMTKQNNLTRMFNARPVMVSSLSGVLRDDGSSSSSSSNFVASSGLSRVRGAQLRGLWLEEGRVVGGPGGGGPGKPRMVFTRARKTDPRASTIAVDGGDDGVYSPEERRRKDRQKALEAAMSEINATFGKGSVKKLGAVHSAFVETLPTGCMTLDWVLGGGLPRGRIVEIYGPESSGKTTLALHAIAQVQKRGGNAMLVDAEHAFDAVYSRNLGVDNENLIVCQPDSGEMALETADRMCRSGAVDLICIDSVSALTPRAEIEGEIGMQQMGLQARLMSQAMRKMSTNASKANCTLVFLNQIRNKVGVVYGSPEVTSGGLALRFFASVRLDVRQIGKLKSSKHDDEVGIRIRVRVKKSKVSRPYRVAEMDLVFGEGISTMGCVLDCAEAFGVLSRKGAWYSFGEHSIGHGRDKAIQHLKENDEMRQTIEQLVREKIAEDAGRDDRGAQGIGVGGIIIDGEGEELLVNDDAEENIMAGALALSD